MRIFSLIAFLPALLAAQDAREIVRRALDFDTKNDVIARSYTYLERQETRELDGAGALKSRKTETWDVTLLEGSPYRRLVARNDRPIPPPEQKKEEERLEKSIAERNKETEEQRTRRIADWNRHRREQRERFRELPQAFDFRVAGEESVNGCDVWIIDATPHPGYKSKTSFGRYLPKMKGRLWIGKNGYSWVKVEIQTLDTISLGGIVARFAKGGRLMLEQTLVNHEVWLPKHVEVIASARVLLVKGVHVDVQYDYSNYRKFQVESKVVAVGP